MAAPAQGYSSPHTRSIADLVRRGGDIQADTTARRGEISGRMWQGIGETAGNFLSQLGEENWKGPERQRQIEAQKKREALDVASAEQAIAEKQAKAEAVTKETGIQAQIGVYRSRAMKQNDDGTWALDLSNLRQQMESAGLGDRMDEIEQRYVDIQKDTLSHSLTKKQLAAIEDTAFAKMGRMIQDMGNTPQAFSAAAAHFTQNGMLSDNQIAKYVERAEKDPKAIGQIAAGLASLDKKEAPVKEIVPGSFADVVARKEAETGKPLTSQEALTLRRRYESTGWKPERAAANGGEQGLSDEAVATSKRWKVTELGKAEATKDDELKAAVEAFNAKLNMAMTKDPNDPTVVEARAFMDAAKKDIYDRLEKKKQQIYRDFADQVGAAPQASGPRVEAPAPKPFSAGYQSPAVESLSPAAPAPGKYAGRVISRARVEQLARQSGISFEEAKARAERAFGVVVR